MPPPGVSVFVNVAELAHLVSSGRFYLDHLCSEIPYHMRFHVSFKVFKDIASQCSINVAILTTDIKIYVYWCVVEGDNGFLVTLSIIAPTTASIEGLLLIRTSHMACILSHHVTQELDNRTVRFLFHFTRIIYTTNTSAFIKE